MSEAEVRETFGPWSGLATSALVAVVDPVDRPDARLLSVLVAFADACAARLRILATDAQLLLGPQRTAVSLVEELRTSSPGWVRRTQLLQAAEEELGRAVRATPSHEQRALLQLQQALMAVALSDVDAELHWVREARRSTDLRLEELVAAAQKGSHQLQIRLVDTRAGGVRSRSRPVWAALDALVAEYSGLLLAAHMPPGAEAEVRLGKARVQVERLAALGEVVHLWNLVSLWESVIRAEPVVHTLALEPDASGDAARVVRLREIARARFA